MLVGSRESPFSIKTLKSQDTEFVGYKTVSDSPLPRVISIPSNPQKY